VSKFFFYGHSGSDNHGCEAIVRSTFSLIKGKEAYLFVDSIEKEMKYEVDKVCKLLPQAKGNNSRYSIRRILYSVIRRISGNVTFSVRNNYRNLFLNINKSDLAISIGGDNYCYSQFISVLGILNKSLSSKGIKTVLWGCSVEPELLKNPEILADLKRYTMITARESITYQALLDAGVNGNIHLVPDTAFCLETQFPSLPIGSFQKKTIGINVSKLVQKYEKVKGITVKNIENLIRYIIEITSFDIILIPHVVWAGDNDLEPLNELYRKFEDTGRIKIVDDSNCMKLKGVISKCRMFIGARTHATIAAYSSCVPTLTLGYSVKSKGIAKDLFGTHENYVLPVNEFEDENDLIKAFDWLAHNEDGIRNHLLKIIPSFIEKARNEGELLERLLEND